MKKVGWGPVGGGRGLEVGLGEGGWDQELNVLLKEHKGIVQY